MATLNQAMDNMHDNGYGHGLSKKALRELGKELFETIAQYVYDDEKVSVPEFGIFRSVSKPPRQAYNPQTREPVQVPAKEAMKFTPSKALKEWLQEKLAMKKLVAAKKPAVKVAVPVAKKK